MKAIQGVLSIMAMLTVALPVCRGADHTGSRSQADRTKWYREAKFGMFIHWGPYSLASVEASWPIMEPEPQWASPKRNTGRCRNGSIR